MKDTNNMIGKLEKRLIEWMGVGIISQEQGKEIRRYEQEKSNSSWVIPGLLILGSIIIGVGIISLIAANWNKTPVVVKLVGNFSVLVSLGYAIYYCNKISKTILFEIFILSFIIQCMASIGLISQVFHANGKLYEALLLWSTITLPIVLLSRYAYVSLIWVLIFTSAACYALIDSNFTRAFFEGNYYAVFIMIPFLCFNAASVFSAAVKDSLIGKSFSGAALLSIPIGLAVAEMSVEAHITTSYSIVQYIPAYLLFALFQALLIRCSNYSHRQKFFIMLLSLFYLIQFHLINIGVSQSIVFAIITILVFLGMAIFFSGIKSQKMFHWCLFFAGIRFIVIYFQALGGLLMTGIGLITSGLLLILLTIGWNKYRKVLPSITEGWIK